MLSKNLRSYSALLWIMLFTASAARAQAPSQDPLLTMMNKAAAHAKAHGDRYVPALSPAKETVLGADPFVHVKELQDAGILVVPWTIDDMDGIRAMLALHVDGIISDRPDMLAAALAEARTKAAGNPAELAYLARVDMEGHRGGRGLRPENTLPAFEVGLDNGIHSIETDTGVTTDHQSLIWHDQFLNPRSCRRVDGKPYTQDNRVYISDISIADAQQQFVCDKLYFDSEQTNDLSLSPVSVAFALQEHMINPYAPTYVAQLFRFVAFYERWYRSGPGKNAPHAAERARTAAAVHFNLETKIVPDVYSEAKIAEILMGKTEAEVRASGKLEIGSFTGNHTVGPDVFVDVLCGAVRDYHMESRSDIQSFDFRTLQLVEEKFPGIRTFYLTQSPVLLHTDFVPADLRLPAQVN